ncbi:hypothetical protein BLOT_012523, partial [Blomia tropicalis]
MGVRNTSGCTKLWKISTILDDYLYSNDTHVKVGTFRNRSFNSNFINSVFYFTNVGVFISIALELYRLYSKSYIVHRLTTTDVAIIKLDWFDTNLKRQDIVTFNSITTLASSSLNHPHPYIIFILYYIIFAINFHIHIVPILFSFFRLPHNSAILEMMTCICKTSIISGKLKLNLLSVHILIPFFLLGYSEIQFQSCLSLHHPNNCCDQFPCPSFNFSNHTYFYLVISDWITHYHLFDTFVLYLVLFLCYHSIDRQTILVFIRINFIRVYFSHLIQLENFIAFKEYLDNLKWQLLQVIVMFNAIPSSLIVVINFHIQIVHILARLPHNSAILEMMTCICKHSINVSLTLNGPRAYHYACIFIPL